MRRVILATALLSGCPSPAANRPHSGDDTAVRVRIARAEARRGGGVDELALLATHGDLHPRELALRGLGRVGGPQAMDVLTRAVDDPDLEISAAALDAIGIAATLDEPRPDPLAGRSGRPHCVVAGVEGSKGCAGPSTAQSVVAIEAFGRAGDQSDQAVLAHLFAGPPATIEAAALALGRMGRRKIALTPEARAALVAATAHADLHVRYAATYALSREHEPPADDDDAANAALVARIRDEDPETRAVAIAGLAKRNAIASGRGAIEHALGDLDWRVAVEAVRALAGEHGDDAGRDEVAAAAVRRLGELDTGSEAATHVVIEGLRVLQPHGARPLVADALSTLWQGAHTAHQLAPLLRGWIECLAMAARERAMPDPELGSLAHCGGGNLPDHLQLPLLAELVTAGAGNVATRHAAMQILMQHADARVRAAGLGALAATWPDGDHATIIATLASAIGSADPIVAGAAVEAAPSIYNLAGADPTLDAAVIARAAKEVDAELSSSLYELIGKRAIAAGAAACRSGLTGAPVPARAAATCLHALGEAVPAPRLGAATPPPVDVADVIGKDLRWHVVTTRGEIVIAMRPDVAPWNVATIVALTRKHFYDGLEFHRVVPGFVVQGGDPTMSGAGGPGFTTPAEPGGAFATGGVGIADAGRDSGGSQWFIMHGRAPHLDGRYTWIGRVVTGQKAVDALLVGDKVVRATIEQVR